MRALIAAAFVVLIAGSASAQTYGVPEYQGGFSQPSQQFQGSQQPKMIYVPYQSNQSTGYGLGGGSTTTNQPAPSGSGLNYNGPVWTSPSGLNTIGGSPSCVGYGCP